ncbi:AI-2E family transporter [Selenihalanaerobacter shriftii]|uniref:Predicted PurR-regulated permease PerM n=1 Tax=Selenihalanaerobacter shriftii TaxID=142842 RepID=A0A1T4LDR0_9FIRM|nr:AI-2E family transporter [Selenihalanaerobacter shriftii]SJZ52865.1 Predicted PurR-regulated permease PerM [Selenihalanaerobacter shriftii]
MFKGKFFKTAYAVILILVIILLLGQIPYVMKPLSTVLSIIIFPLLLGGFLYYLLRPLVRFFVNKVNNKTIAIIITFLIVIAFWAFVIYFGGSIIYSEVKELFNYFSFNYETTKQSISQIINFSNEHFRFLKDLNLQKRLLNFVKGLLSEMSNYNFMGTFSSLSNLATIIVLIPFVVFYFLKDDDKIHDFLLSALPSKNQHKLERTLQEIDQILSAYISSQLIVALILGVLMFIGYLIIGLPNVLGLALIAMVTSFIPILGPSLGILPALLIALTTSLLMVIKVLVVLSITQYLEGNLIRPLVQGEKLNIHPLVVLFLIIISILLFGILGALFAVPIYAVIRIVIKNRAQFTEEV